MPRPHPIARRASRGGPRSLFVAAVVAAIAYLDPGGVATNLTAGAATAYLLVWWLWRHGTSEGRSTH